MRARRRTAEGRRAESGPRTAAFAGLAGTCDDISPSPELFSDRAQPRFPAILRDVVHSATQCPLEGKAGTALVLGHF